jgi:hypothetical protein
MASPGSTYSDAVDSETGSDAERLSATATAVESEDALAAPGVEGKR